MAYSETLAVRIRALLASRNDVTEKKMFGGLCVMVSGSMACGIIGDDFLARVGAEGHDAALGRPHTKIMAFTGRPLRGFILVEPAGVRTPATLKRWIDETVASAIRAGKEKKTKAKKKRLGKH